MKRNQAQSQFIDLMFRTYRSESESRAIWSEWLKVRHGGRINWELNFLNDLTSDELEVYRSDLKRLQEHEPIAYVLGELIWAGLKFKIDNRALIPRPETEELLFLLFKNVINPLRIVDACTGSGCIAIASKIKYPLADVIGFDISRDALKLADENSKLNQANLKLYQNDLMRSIPKWVKPKNDDVWVGNPPYITPSESLDRSLNFEPDRALFSSDSNPIIYYDKISQWAQVGLKTKGILLFEVNYKYATMITELLQKQDVWSEIQIFKDNCGKDRFIKSIRL